MAAAATGPQRLGDALVSFSLDGVFPDAVAELPPVSETDLQPAIDALAGAKTQLETEIHSINQETKDDVSSWISNAKTLQDDIIRSKSMANEIVRLAESPQTSGEAIRDAEVKADFLCHEVQYAQQLHSVLARLQNISRVLSDVERAKDEGRILDSLHLLERSWTALDEVGVTKSCRVMRLLNVRSFELKTDVHDVLDRAWKRLVRIDMDAHKAAIYDSLDGENLSLADAVVGFKAYKEVDERMEQLWRNLEVAILSPRMDKSASAVPAIRAGADGFELDGEAEPSVDALVSDLEEVFAFLARKLPPDLLQSLSGVMTDEFVPKLIQQWLDPAVPTSLTDMTGFQDMVRRTNEFCAHLKDNGYAGFDELGAWASKAPMTWIGKRRETALDSVRKRLWGGVGESKAVEKVERQMVSLSEGRELATAGAGAAADRDDWGDDWGDAWDDDEGGEGEQDAKDSKPPPEAPSTDADAKEAPSMDADAEDDGAGAWGWGEEETAEKPAAVGEAETPATEEDEDDSAEAWGWGEEDATIEPDAGEKKAAGAAEPERGQRTRELVLRETYHISSMPEPVLELIFGILEDGATLSKGKEEFELVASTAPGLFGLPTLVLALFRAISPHYYALNDGGNMFLYNDATYMAERLAEFSSAWKQRDDLGPRALSMLRLEGDIKTMHNFANRSYANEMQLQRTVLQDLLGSSQSLTQQDDMEAAAEAGTARVRAMAATWEPILARSVWSQAVGLLTDALATRLIADVLDMAEIGQEEAYRIAKLISSVTELDDLFPGTRAEGEGVSVPRTAQFAPNWLRLQYLGELLQSNLNEVRYLWVESELSLYFTADEVVEFVLASFADNARTRETIKEIKNKPEPLAGR
ncbi:hypothetical protein CDD83_1669 [Cordyceps sp. RAO-2017]|nr:hypothetical protein CDD83_1669 [Cordyceps sp. RAO-2017]